MVIRTMATASNCSPRVEVQVVVADQAKDVGRGPVDLVTHPAPPSHSKKPQTFPSSSTASRLLPVVEVHEVLEHGADGVEHLLVSPFVQAVDGLLDQTRSSVL